MKKLITILTVVVLVTGLTAASSYAGAARRHTIEGIMIGTGVAILGAAIYNGMNNDRRHTTYAPAYDYNYKPRHHKRRHHHRRHVHHGPWGHWEIEKYWVEPIYETRWNPGHYNRHGDWITGQYQKFCVRQGYWDKRKVWVRH